MPSAKTQKARSTSVRETTARADTPPALDAEVVSRFLIELAHRVRTNAELARELGAALVASGLLEASSAARTGSDGVVPAAEGTSAPRARRATTRALSRSGGMPGESEASLPDPFALLRAGGEEAVREGLSRYDSYELQRIIRAHRLDPARISARWTARERLLSLIVDQVRARANHGRAFERV